MKRLGLFLSGSVVALALAFSPAAWAQARPSGGGGGGGGGSHSGGGGGGGHAVPRGSEGGGSSTASSGSSGGTYSGSSGGAVTAPTPSHGSSSGAVSRPGGARSRAGAVGSGVHRGDAGAARGEAVPRGSRPNTRNNPSIGSAVARTGRPPVPGDNSGSYYWPSYYGGYYGGYGGYGYGYGSPYGYGSNWGLGLYMYNPFWWGYGYPGYWDPYGGGFGSGGWASIYPGEYAGGGYSAPDSYAKTYPPGALKLKVKPRDAEVYVDGYFVGQVDSYDGAFQHLDVEVGTHQVEVRAPGYQPLTFEVKMGPRQNLTYKGELKRTQ